MPETEFPFVALVGQQLMKKSILLAIINPQLSPVLIRGFRGTAKSTIIHSLPDIVPDIEVTAGCEYNCNPAEQAGFCLDCRARSSTSPLETRMRPMPIVQLSSQYNFFAKRFRTLEGWAAELKTLAKANRGIVAVEKINLYNERMTESILNFGLKGYKTVETDAKGAKASEAPRMSRFIMIATMNIEDGELSPDLMDKFALQVNVRDISDIEERIEITKRATDYEKNPAQFHSKYGEEMNKLRKRVVKAREDLSKVECPPKVRETISGICKKFKLGKAEEIIEQAALTNAAYEGKKYITIDDIKEILDITVPHRL